MDPLEQGCEMCHGHGKLIRTHVVLEVLFDSCQLQT